MIASQTSAIKSIFVPPAIPSNITPQFIPYDTVLLGEGAADGPNPNFSSQGLGGPDYGISGGLKWANQLSGDYLDANNVLNGSTHYVSTTWPSIGPWDVTGIVRKMIVDGNTGFFLSSSTNSPQIAGLETGTPPTLQVVTSTGTFNPPCTLSCFIDSPSAQTQNQANRNYISIQNISAGAAFLKFDLGALTGSITSATLSVTVIGTPIPQNYVCRVDYAKMPALIWDTPRQVGGVVQGIAAAGANDFALASHPSVIFYPSFESEAAFNASSWNRPLNQGTISPPTYVAWPQYGLTAMRFASNTSQSDIVAFWHIFGGNHTELYCRYLLKIDPDVYVGMTERGVKLPGFDATIGGGDMSYRMEHLKQSPSNQQAYGYFQHAYDAEHSVTNFPSDAENRPMDIPACLVAGRIYCIEQYVKMNTDNGAGVYNSDGIFKVWIDGVLMRNDTTRKIRVDQIPIYDFHFNIYHGGLGAPSAPIHYEVSGVCAATQYIGPPKIVNLPLWRPPAGFFADIPSMNTPVDVFTHIYDSQYGNAAWTYPFSLWCGGTFIHDYSSLGAFALHGAGHENSITQWNIQGTLTFDFSASLSAGKWEYHNAPTQAYADGAGNINYNQAGEFGDGSTYGPHTYLGVQEMPASWGGGPKGSLAVFTGIVGGGSGGIAQTTHKIDLSQATLGYSRLSEGFAGDTYPSSVKDESRQGWWVANSSAQMRFISKSGSFGPITAAGFGGIGARALTMWPSKNVVIQINSTNPKGSSHPNSIDVYNTVTNTVQNILTTGKPPVLVTSDAFAQEMATIAVVNGGTGYAVNDTITFFSPDTNAFNPQNSPKVVVTAIGAGGSVASVSFFNFSYSGFTLPQTGWYSSAPPSNPLSQQSTSGAGTGATFNATWQNALDTFATNVTGLHWVEPLRCIVGFDPLAVEIVTLTPPVGDIYASPWVWTRPTVSHWAAGDPSGQATLNPGAGLRIYSKFQYIETLRAFVLFTVVDPITSVYRPPQIITLPGL